MTDWVGWEGKKRQTSVLPEQTKKCPVGWERVRGFWGGGK